MAIPAATKSNKYDVLLFSLIIVILFIALFLNYYLNLTNLTKLIVWFVSLPSIVAAYLFSSYGSFSIQFLKETNIELKKVTWPTKRETTQVTIIVLSFAIVLAILLWLVDSFFLYLITFISGQK